MMNKAELYQNDTENQLRLALYKMVFAYVNKDDGDMPHDFELEALSNAYELLDDRQHKKFAKIALEMREGETLKHHRTNEVICPWCGYEHEDSWEYEGEEHSNPSKLGLIKCGSCDKCFNAVREIEVYYSTEKGVYGKCEKCHEENKLLDEYSIGFNEKSYECLYQMLCEKCGRFSING